MSKVISKSGYIGVYKNRFGNLYRFESYKTIDSKEIRHIVGGFKTAFEAYKAKIKYEHETQEIIIAKHLKSSINYLVEGYLEWIKSSVRLTTFHHKILLINKYIKRNYGHLRIAMFCRSDNLKQFKENLINRNISTNQKNKVLHELEEIFKYGVLLKYLKNDLANNVYAITKRLKDNVVVEKKNDVYWTIDEWNKFLSNIPEKDDWYAFFSLLGQLGCRVGEIRGLQVKHINLNEGTIRIEQQILNNVGIDSYVIAPPKTKSGIRTIDISDSMISILKKYYVKHKINKPDNFLFFNKTKPTSVSNIRRCFDRYTIIAGLNHIKLHGIRHSNTTWLLSEDLNPQDIAQVSKRLGHASIRETLDTYLYVHEKKNKKIINTLETITKTKKKGKQKNVTTKN